jgi:hypothetical protein
MRTRQRRRWISLSRRLPAKAIGRFARITETESYTLRESIQTYSISIGTYDPSCACRMYCSQD